MSKRKADDPDISQRTMLRTASEDSNLNVSLNTVSHLTLSASSEPLPSPLYMSDLNQHIPKAQKMVDEMSESVSQQNALVAMKAENSVVALKGLEEAEDRVNEASACLNDAEQMAMDLDIDIFDATEKLRRMKVDRNDESMASDVLKLEREIENLKKDRERATLSIARAQKKLTVAKDALSTALKRAFERLKDTNHALRTANTAVCVAYNAVKESHDRFLQRQLLLKDYEFAVWDT
mgnify:CR=1 FL=1